MQTIIPLIVLSKMHLLRQQRPFPVCEASRVKCCTHRFTFALKELLTKRDAERGTISCGPHKFSLSLPGSQNKFNGLGSLNEGENFL